MDKLLKFNNKLIKSGNNIVCSKPVDPYNPLNLPPNTVRVRTSDGDVPHTYGSYNSATLVPGTTDVYDVYKSGTSFNQMFRASSNVIEVLGANTSNIADMSSMFYQCTLLTNVSLFDTSKVTYMTYMFFGCTSLTNVALFDTSNVTMMYYMFNGCTSLITVPLFNTSKVTTMERMFYDCTSVQNGALALYQQASTQTKPPSKHSGTFTNCGSNTQTGAAELAQIPDDWK